ncbi:hypothetical protein HMPREF0653_01682 [Prevotella disiens JCM 6334 = ATCC 29426]|uniref:Uncharacterized protein n=1 Tax=Prevotella disiens JCM 6334 = ATCC 29426 TaxID=1235811 RepID=A0ABP2Y9L2_9BACT|nr:hypothetical protein HMPREF0653_01682 [Prevotella disiens JCM 6334 = ATCC 29426]
MFISESFSFRLGLLLLCSSFLRVVPIDCRLVRLLPFLPLRLQCLKQHCLHSLSIFLLRFPFSMLTLLFC